MTESARAKKSPEQSGTEDASLGVSDGPLNKERDQSVDVLRGLAIVLVVFGHANRGVIDDHVRTALNLPLIDFVLYTFHMPVFFYLAGYFTLASLKSGTVRQFLQSRLYRIAWPYLLWSVIYFCLGQAMSRLTNVNHPVQIADLLHIGWKPINILWFLYGLLVLQIILVFARKRLGLTLIVSVFIDLLCSSALPVPNRSILYLTVVHAPFFLAGALIATRKRSPLFWTIKTSYLLLFAAASVVGATVFYALGARISVQFITIPLSVCGIIALGTCSAVMSRFRSPIAFSVSSLGRASLAIYLLHPLFLALVPRLLRLAHFDGAAARLIVGTIVGVGFSFAAYLLINRTRLLPVFGLR